MLASYTVRLCSILPAAAAAAAYSIAGKPTTNTFRILCKDGSLHWLRCRATPVFQHARVSITGSKQGSASGPSADAASTTASSPAVGVVLYAVLLEGGVTIVLGA